MLLMQIIPIPMIGAQTPYMILGTVYDSEGAGVMGVTVYINNTRTNHSSSVSTDPHGRYSIDLNLGGSDPGSCQIDDILAFVAVYNGHLSSNTLVVKAQPYQIMNLTFGFRAFVIEGHVNRAVDGTIARYFNVQITNEARNESRTYLADVQGYYRMELSTFPSGFAIGDSIKVSVNQQGFAGLNYSTVSANHGETLDIAIFDIQSPVTSLQEAPSSINLNQPYRIIVRITENYQLGSVKLYIKKTGQPLFTEVKMLMDNGTTNDWNADGMPNIQIWGQSTARNLPLQTGIGDLFYYIVATDSSGNVATLPDSSPQYTPYIIKVIDPIMPTISHTPISLLEAGKKGEVIVIADDNIGIGEVRLMYKGVGQSIFTSVPMNPTGDPKQYNASIPAQTSLETAYYYLSCNDTSNNTVRLPAAGEWSVSVVDTIPPVITHSDINSARLNGSINFTCSVSEILLNSVWLNYTYGAASDNVTMSFDSAAGTWYHQIATLATLETMHYTLWANDTSGNLANISHAFPVLDGDIPLISHEPPSQIELGVITAIGVYVEDNVEISFVNLSYLPVGASSYYVITMNSTDAPVITGFGNYSAAIPAQFALGEVRYIINATDGSNNSISWPSLSPYRTVEVRDTVPPEFYELTYPQNTQSGHTARVQVNITDVDSIAYARLYYLNSTASQWTAVEMTLNGSHVYECLIPAHAPGQVKFYLASNDSSDNRATLPAITPKLAPYVMNFTDDNPPELELSIPNSLYVNRTAEAFLNISDDMQISSFEIQYSGVNDLLLMPLELFQISLGSFKCTLPPQMESGTVRIFATASDGINHNQTQIYNISVVNLPPTITHSPPGIVPLGHNFSLIAQVSDDLHVENVSLEWKFLGGLSNIVEMDRISTYYRVNLSFPEPATINYRIIANDAESVSAWPESGFRELRILDTESPAIHHVPLANLTNIQMPIITAKVTDNWQVESVKVWYRNSTSDTFISASMSPVSGTDDFAVLLGRQSQGNFSYYIEASDGSNDVVSPATGFHTVFVEDASVDDFISEILFIALIALMLMASILVYLHHRRKSINDAADSGDERVENDENPR